MWLDFGSSNVTEIGLEKKKLSFKWGNFDLKRTFQLFLLHFARNFSPFILGLGNYKFPFVDKIFPFPSSFNHEFCASVNKIISALKSLTGTQSCLLTRRKKPAFCNFFGWQAANVFVKLQPESQHFRRFIISTQFQRAFLY